MRFWVQVFYWFSRLSVNSSLQLVIALVHFLKMQGSFPKMPRVGYIKHSWVWAFYFVTEIMVCLPSLSCSSPSSSSSISLVENLSHSLIHTKKAFSWERIVQSCTPKSLRSWILNDLIGLTNKIILFYSAFVPQGTPFLKCFPQLYSTSCGLLTCFIKSAGKTVNQEAAGT